jgi:hypothetical protein
MPSNTSDPATATGRQPGGGLRSPVVRAMANTLFYDIGLSVIAYFAAELLGASNFLALLAGAVVSGLRTLWVALRHGRLDPFAFFLLVLFGVSLALSFVTGDPRFILVKDAAQSCTAGLVLLGSCLVKRPLAYYAALRFARSAGDAAHVQFQADARTAAMRARWFRVSLVWGIALLVETGLRIVAVYLLPIGVAANVSQVLVVTVFSLLFLWTVVTAKRAQPAPRTAP